MPPHDRPTALATTAVTAGRPDAVPDAPLNTPMVPASTFVAGGDREYGRYGNPTWEAFETVVGELEGGRAVMFSSGVAAVAAVLGLVPHGGTVVVPRQTYAGTHALLNDLADRQALIIDAVDATDPEAVVAASARAAMVWFESPANPTMEIVDVAATAAAAHDAGALVVVDNTFATPLVQRPLDDGADVVVHSATKLLSGHSDALAGVAVTRSQDLYDRVLAHRGTYGAVPGTLEAYLSTRGIRTLSVRWERASTTAAMLAERLAEHPAVSRVRYPGFGSLLSFEVSGGPESAHRVVMSSRLVRVATSLGGVESTWERRRRWPAEPTTVPEALIRLSVGIEDAEDVWADVAAALDSA